MVLLNTWAKSKVIMLQQLTRSIVYHLIGNLLLQDVCKAGQSGKWYLVQAQITLPVKQTLGNDFFLPTFVATNTSGRYNTILFHLLNYPFFNQLHQVLSRLTMTWVLADSCLTYIQPLSRWIKSKLNLGNMRHIPVAYNFQPELLLRINFISQPLHFIKFSLGVCLAF